ncbi:MAG: HD domain-containing protein [Bacteroidales bacterium]|nr:HD domain-containing protein [Bacteroidales bacterium]
MATAPAFKRKIINDPLYGFITIADKLVFDIIEHPFFQRLRRIEQLGLASMVYPGALHTRFHHAIGAMHLMGQAIETLRSKDFQISPKEAQGATLAILLHDIGHGPFSHALEHHIVHDISHEEITLMFMKQLNSEFDNKLETAIEIFSNTYPRKFLHQLVSGQLDMDRLDYLMRDSFYTGVSEGVISTDRILKMLTVVDDELAVELKGIYSIEKFIVARRLMYWQVYYHKTVLAVEYMQISILNRARALAAEGKDLPASKSLMFFLSRHIGVEQFISSPEILSTFASLDDYDIYCAIKQWASYPDVILSSLCKSLLNRNLFRVVITSTPFAEERIIEIKTRINEKLNLEGNDYSYFTGQGEISNSAYDPNNDRITIVDKIGQRWDISGLSEQLNIAIYNKTVSKFFTYYPKWVEE